MTWAPAHLYQNFYNISAELAHQGGQERWLALSFQSDWLAGVK
jgi:hypothetical protein